LHPPELCCTRRRSCSEAKGHDWIRSACDKILGPLSQRETYSITRSFLDLKCSVTGVQTFRSVPGVFFLIRKSETEDHLEGPCTSLCATCLSLDGHIINQVLSRSRHHALVDWLLLPPSECNVSLSKARPPQVVGIVLQLVPVPVFDVPLSGLFQDWLSR